MNLLFNKTVLWFMKLSLVVKYEHSSLGLTESACASRDPVCERQAFPPHSPVMKYVPVWYVGSAMDGFKEPEGSLINMRVCEKMLGKLY